MGTRSGFYSGRKAGDTAQALSGNLGVRGRGGAGGSRVLPTPPSLPGAGPPAGQVRGSPPGSGVTGVGRWGPPTCRAALRPDPPAVPLRRRPGVDSPRRRGRRTPGFGTGRAAPQDSEPARPRPSARRAWKPLGSQLPRLQGPRGREGGARGGAVTPAGGAARARVAGFSRVSAPPTAPAPWLPDGATPALPPVSSLLLLLRGWARAALLARCAKDGPSVRHPFGTAQKPRCGVGRRRFCDLNVNLENGDTY